MPSQPSQPSRSLPPPPPPRATSPSSSSPTLPTIHTKRYTPYFTSSQLSLLTTHQSMKGKLSQRQVERTRHLATGLIMRIGTSLGFPSRTIATAQVLYHRFHLFFPFKEFNHVEVSLSCLYISCKLHDTLKKPRDILLVSYALLHPSLFTKSPLLLSTRVTPLLAAVTMDPVAIGIDPKMIERDRRKMLSIERLVLESTCFNFLVGRFGSTAVGDVGMLVIKMGKKMKLGQRFLRTVWGLVADSHQTLAPLQHTPQTLVLGSMYLSSLLFSKSGESDVDSEGDVAHKEIGFDVVHVREMVENPGAWEQEYVCSVEEVEDFAHTILDLFIGLLGLPASSDSSGSTSSSAVGNNLSHPSPLSNPSPGENATLNPSSQSGGTVPTEGGGGGPLGQPVSRAQSQMQSQAQAQMQKYHPIQTAFKLPISWTSQSLTQEKIRLRERSSSRPHSGSRRTNLDPGLLPPLTTRTAPSSSGSTSISTSDRASVSQLTMSEQDTARAREIVKGRNAAEIWGDIGSIVQGLGNNDSTTRFLFE